MEHEWERFAPAWHAVFAGLAGLTAVLVAVDDGIGTAARSTALAVLAALAAGYAVLGPRGLRRTPGWAGPAYVGIAAPLTLALFVAAPVGGLMLFAFYPHSWAMLPTRRAVAATVAMVGAVTLVTLVREGLHDPELADTLLQAGISLALALLIGLWISRIIRQSRHRAELLAQLAATRAELAEVSHEAGTLAERERLAREIHDTLAQGFTSILLLLEAAETALDTDPGAVRGHLDRARETARENLAEARALVAAQRPPELSRTSLPEALRRLVGRADTEPDLRATLTVSGAPRALPPEHEIALLRAAQEALTNVRRHARASRVEVALAYGPERVSLRVRDDGCGFDPAAAPAGFGLGGMRARAADVGGLLNIDARPGAGVAVRFDLPATVG